MSSKRPFSAFMILAGTLALAGCGVAQPNAAQVGTQPQKTVATSLPAQIAASDVANYHVLPGPTSGSYTTQQYVGQSLTIQQGDIIAQYQWNGFQWVLVRQWPVASYYNYYPYWYYPSWWSTGFTGRRIFTTRRRRVFTERRFVTGRRFLTGGRRVTAGRVGGRGITLGRGGRR